MINVNLTKKNIPASMDDLEEIGIHTQQEKPFQILIEYICNG